MTRRLKKIPSVSSDYELTLVDRPPPCNATYDCHVTDRPASIQPSSVDRTLDLFNAGWGFLVLRESFFGVRRFDDFQRSLGISRAILAERLKQMVEAEILERRQYQERPPRYEYVLTEKGLELYPIFIALMRWGDRWLSGPEGPPLLLTHRTCGNRTTPIMVCDQCHEPIAARDMSYAPGPGANAPG
jgi:DNA-binding HxlR family transcriptional regulator